jgi:hypothetical protein
MSEPRRNKRRKAEDSVPVVDTMTGQNFGRVGDLSVDGMMLIAEHRVHDNALYQLSFHLPDARGLPVPVEIGVHEQWTASSALPGQYWTGFRIIDISSRDLDTIDDWLHREDHR